MAEAAVASAHGLPAADSRAAGSYGTAAIGSEKAGIMAKAFSRCSSFATPRIPSYCPVRSDPIAETARLVDSTTQPLSCAADQIVPIAQLGPQTRGIASSPSGPAGATGQSGRRSSRRPEAPTASRSRQCSETIVTIVQPTCSGRAPARDTSDWACVLRPAAARAGPLNRGRQGPPG